MTDLTLTEGGLERIDDIRDLWEQLNAHHQIISPHFKDDFAYYEFADRKAYLKSKASLAKLRFFILESGGKAVGYCVASLRPDLHGEIESIYVHDEYRGRHLGDALMRAALRWMDDGGAVTKSVNVVFGNESAFPFYEKYGFYPRSSTLLQR